MRLNELVGYKNDYLNHFNSIENDYTKLNKFMIYLQSNGFEAMGQGSYALVFTHPDLNYCVKIFRPETGYTRFLEFCAMHAQNPHLPKFRGKVTQINNTYSMIRMERLEKVSLSSEEQMIRSLAMLADYPNVQEFIGRFDNVKSKTGEYYRAQPGFVETYKELLDFAGTVSMDLKKENVMKRGSTYVFIDPYMGDII